MLLSYQPHCMKANEIIVYSILSNRRYKNPRKSVRFIRPRNEQKTNKLLND